MIRITALLFLFLFSIGLRAQNPKLEKFGKEVYILMQTNNYSGLRNVTVSKDAPPLGEEFGKMDAVKKADFLNTQPLKGYSRLIDIHGRLYEKGIDWTQTRLKNAYTLPDPENKSFETVLVVFQDKNGLDYVMELLATATAKGYRLTDRGIYMERLSPKADEYLKKIGVSDHTPSGKYYESFSPDDNQPASDTIVRKTDQLISRTFLNHGKKYMVTLEDQLSKKQTRIRYYSNGVTEDSSIYDPANDMSKDFGYSILGKPERERICEGKTVSSSTYYANGSLKTEGSMTEGKKQGVHTTYHYNGQILERTNYINDKPSGVVTRYSILGDVISEKKYSSTPEIQSVEDLKYFLSFEEAFRYITRNYDETGILFRKPDGWYVSKRGESKSEYLFWSFKDQSFVSLSVFKKSGNAHYYDEIAKYYKPATLFSGYEAWPDDVIRLLGSAPMLPDSLKKSLFAAYIKQMERAILKNDPASLEKYSEMASAPPSRELSQDFLSFNFLKLALVAMSVHNESQSKKFLSLIRFSDNTLLHGKRLLEECESGSLFVTQHGLLLYGIQLTQDFRSDVSLIDIYMLDETWYRQFMRQKLGVEFTVPEQRYQEFGYIKLESSDRSGYKDMLVGDMLTAVKEKTDSGPVLMLPYNVNNLNMPLSRGLFYRFNTAGTYGTYNIQAIAQMDVLNSCLIKNPDTKVMYEGNTISGSPRLPGFIVNILLSQDSAGNRQAVLRKVQPSEMALKIRSIREIDSVYYNYYAYKIAGLIQIYAGTGDKARAQQLLNHYMLLFAKVETGIDLSLRADIIQQAYMIENPKIAEEYMKTTRNTISRQGPSFSRKDVKNFNSTMLSFFETASREDGLKKFFPAEYEAREKRKKESAGKSNYEGAGPPQYDIAAPGK